MSKEENDIIEHPAHYTQGIECMDYIAAKVSIESRLMQVAEECAELIQAASKLIRLKAGDNPTVIEKDEAIDNLVEEIADVNNAIAALRLDDVLPSGTLEEKEREKIDRWFKRIKKEEARNV